MVTLEFRASTYEFGGDTIQSELSALKGVVEVGNEWSGDHRQYTTIDYCKEQMIGGPRGGKEGTGERNGRGIYRTW